MEDVVILVAVVAVSIFVSFNIGGSLGRTDATNIMRTEAISRGYAMYCPDDGEFAWIGECDD